MNNLKKTYRTILGLSLLFIFFYSCSTEDVPPIEDSPIVNESPDALPTLSVSSTESTLSEDGDDITVTAKLNKAASETVSIPVNFTGVSKIDQDFTVSNQKIVINSGETFGNIKITGKQDSEVEGTETLIITLVPPASKFTVPNDLSLQISVLDDDSDSDGDGVLDTDDECTDVAGDAANNGCPFLGFIINEVLYDPPTDTASGDVIGDANEDGHRHKTEDEFIEFFNSGPELDISGYTISDATKVRHIFPVGTIVPKNGVIVVFGGGTPSTLSGAFGGAIVQTASEGTKLNLNNNGDKITVRKPMALGGGVLVEFDITPLSDAPKESYTRSPDLTGEFEQHDQGIPLSGGRLFSPGTKLDGASF